MRKKSQKVQGGKKVIGRSNSRDEKSQMDRTVAEVGGVTKFGFIEIELNSG